MQLRKDYLARMLKRLRHGVFSLVFVEEEGVANASLIIA